MLHLSNLLAVLHCYHVRQRVVFLNAVVQRAAEKALQDPSGFPVEVPGWPRLVRPDAEGQDLVDFDEEPPPDLIVQDLKTRAKQEIDRRRGLIQALASGKASLLRMSGHELDLDSIYLPEYRDVCMKFPIALIEVERGRLGAMGQQEYLKQPPWEYACDAVSVQADIPCSEEVLAKLAWLVYCEQPPQNSPLLAALARLHNAGFTDRLLDDIRTQYPNEYTDMINQEILPAAPPTTADRADAGLPVNEATAVEPSAVKRRSSSVPKKVGGRPGLKEAEERKRTDLLDRWKLASEASIPMKTFCEDARISIEYLEKCVDWACKKRARSGGTRRQTSPVKCI